MLEISFKRSDSFDLLTVEVQTDLVPIAYVHQQLDKLIQEHDMRGKLLKINGLYPVALCYTIAKKVSALYSAIAVYDSLSDGYIVSASKNPDYSIGQVI
ncbi:MAG: hypothetical protein ICV78_26565 [Tolypothrix sp. Co-bin9]|nr:hypothetical protein [Tolypothrix sp. Co-bin9]